jgi:hypothetical protein
MNKTHIPKFLATAATALVVGSTLLGVTPASAAPSGSDLAPTWVSPGPVQANTPGHYEVRVPNTGNKNSTNPTTLVIQLPMTATSPNPFVLGTVSNLSTGCALGSGGKITCSLGSIPRFVGVKVVGFDMVLPVKAGPINFRADVTTANDINPGNNGASVTAPQTYTTVSDAAPVTLTVTSCTGRNLTSFIECVPGSTQQHQVGLVPGGTLDFSMVGAPYTGTWAVAGTELTMTYMDGVDPAGTFTGQGSSANCWEGPMVFPNSVYVAIYRVCR